MLAAAGAALPAGGKTGALVAPSATPDPDIAFSAPGAVDSQFGGGNAAPSASGFTQRQPATAGDTPADQAAQPVSLASASALPAPQATGGAGAPDAAIGSPKLVKAAASGDPAAAFEVAARYAAGDHVSKDLAKAAEWYQRAAEGGVAVAQYRLGSLYERGQGVTKDLTKAVDWYQRAADQGNVNAMHNLAVLMSEGVDGAPDQQKALQWFLAAADYGVRDSQYNLGVIYARGLGTPQDLVASYKWFAIAAAQGDSDAAPRRDEVAKLLTGNDLAKARAAVQAWHAKPPLADANGVSTPQGGWDSPGRTLGDADRAALVKKIQTLLAEQGFDPGPADGVAGSRTRDAVKAYQRENGIAADRPDRRRAGGGADRPAHLTAMRRRGPMSASRPPRPAAAAATLTGAQHGRFIRRTSVRPAFPRIRSCPPHCRRADLSAHSRDAGEHADRPRHGRRGRLPVGPVRRRRRLPADAALDLFRHSAGGLGRHRGAADRRLVGLGRAQLLAAAADRPQARHGAAARRHPGQQPRRAGVQCAAGPAASSTSSSRSPTSPSWGWSAG